VVVRPGLSESIRDFVVDASAGALTRAVKSRPFVADSSSEIDREIHGGIRCPGASERCVIVPLVLKEKVGSWYIEARGTKKGHLDGEELLVLTTGAWLEAGSGRKPAARDQTHETDAG
jgi:hypothetical protein